MAINFTLTSTSNSGTRIGLIAKDASGVITLINSTTYNSSNTVSYTFDTDTYDYYLVYLAYRTLYYKFSNQNDDSTYSITFARSTSSTYVDSANSRTYYYNDSEPLSFPNTNEDFTLYANIDETTLPTITPSTQTEITITEGTLTNCSCSYTPTTIYQGNSVTFTFTANTGYQFNTPPTVNNGTSDLDTTLSDDKLTATLTITDTSNITTLTYTGIAELISTTSTINTQTITNISNKYAYAIIYKTESSLTSNWYLAKTINIGNTETVTESDFTNTPYNNEYYLGCLTGVTMYWKIGDNDLAYITPTVTVNIDSTLYYRNNTAITLNNANTVLIGDNENQFETNITIEAGTIENSTVTYTPTTLTKGNSITFTFTANDGYNYTNANIPYVILTDNDNEETTQYATIASDNLSATLTISNTNEIVIINYNSRASVIVSYTYDFISIYNPTSDNMRELSKQRFYEQIDSNSAVTLVDLAQYITSLKLFYCNLPTSGTQTIILGNSHNTGVSCPIITDDIITLNCGNVTIESTNENSNDYNADISIIIPFCGSYSLDADRVMNREITLSYTISIINGNCIATISSNNIVLYTFTGKIAIDIPYILDTNYKTQFTLDDSTLYGFTPKITVVYHENYNNNNTALVNDESYAELSTLTGLNYIEDIDIIPISNTTLLQDEIDMIISNLNNGVIF